MSLSEDEAMQEIAPVDEETEGQIEDGDDGDADSHAAVVAVATEDTADTPGHADEDSGTQNTGKDDDEEMKSVATVKSELTHDDDDDEASHSKKATPSSAAKKKSPKRKSHGSAKKARSPAVKGLHIPFRSVKRTMKLDPGVATVQNEAAILTTLAAELFVKNLAKESLQTAKSHGRHTIRYEDVAEARTKDPAMSFLDILMP